MNLESIMSELVQARANRVPLSPFTEKIPLTLEKAYEIQKLNLNSDLKSGEKLVGYKMGLTSRAKQKDVQVFEPIRGYLLESMQFAHTGELDISPFIHPRVEPEIILRTNREFSPSTALSNKQISLNEIEESVDFVALGIEILDSRFEGFKFKIADVVADNTSAAGFLVGRTNLLASDINLLGIVVKINGIVVETGTPAAVLGNPYRSLLELVSSLSQRGESLPQGSWILTGGMTASQNISHGDLVEISSEKESISFRVVDRSAQV